MYQYQTMPKTLNARIGAHIDHRAGKLKVSYVAPLSDDELEAIRVRLHFERMVELMPKAVDKKVGSREGRSAATVEWLISFDELLSGEYLAQAIRSGLRLEAGEDFNIVNDDGEVELVKTAPEKVAKILKLEIAERLNRPTTVRIPPTGKDVKAEDRQWVEFRPRAEFASDEERYEYISRLV